VTRTERKARLLRNRSNKTINNNGIVVVVVALVVLGVVVVVVLVVVVAVMTRKNDYFLALNDSDAFRPSFWTVLWKRTFGIMSIIIPSFRPT
jgi:hypothetical protein